MISFSSLLLHTNIRLSQHHLLKKLPFPTDLSGYLVESQLIIHMKVYCGALRSVHKPVYPASAMQHCFFFFQQLHDKF